ncbi:hypothetical protein HHK36_012957 [Tetracentron sinense]|uniref:Uncharacterized protein n=1 Tax=Tetracentron sinense TaxID=13715 RepID=A0A834ZDU1_TETSI|nr:hypothetical protein HHK36_012957 [Tetracentron sinense]
MESKLGEKSRREKRKDARLTKQKNRFLSWIQHQKSSKSKRTSVDSKLQNRKKSATSFNDNSEKRVVRQSDVIYERDRIEEQEQPSPQKKSKVKLDALGGSVPTSSKMAKKQKTLKRKSKTKVEEYLEAETNRSVVSAQYDLELERKLAKKLKVKDGRLRGIDDGINVLFDGFPSIPDFLKEDIPDAEEAPRSLNPRPSSKGRKKRKTLDVSEQGPEDKMSSKADAMASDLVENSVAQVSLEEPSVKASTLDGNAKYVAPHLRFRAGHESEQYSQIRRRVRGLLNRLSESNVESVTEEISSIFRDVRRGDAPFDPIDLSHIFEEDDPLDVWLDDPGEPVLDEPGDPARPNTYLARCVDDCMVGSRPSGGAGTSQRRHSQARLSGARPGRGNVDDDDEFNELMRTPRSQEEGVHDQGGVAEISEDDDDDDDDGADDDDGGDDGGDGSGDGGGDGGDVGGSTVVMVCVHPSRGRQSQTYTRRRRGIGQQPGEGLDDMIHGMDQVSVDEHSYPVGGYAAIFAAFVAGMACLVGIDFGAKLITSLAKSFEVPRNWSQDLHFNNIISDI